MKSHEQLLGRLSWLFAFIGAAPGVIAWYSGRGEGLSDITGYSLFPLFGLVAFGLMWSHYMTAAFRLAWNLNKVATKNFRSITGWIVLVAVILHPSILAYNLARDGLGLPPNSYLNNYVSPNLKWAASVGMFSLLIFLAYELHRWFDDKKWWPYVQLLSDIAMIGILVHGFKLGGELQAGWFRSVWLIYAVTLIASQIYIYFFKFKKRNMLG